MHKKFISGFAVVALAAAAMSVSACSEQEMARQRATEAALNRKYFVPTISLDFINYDKRQRRSDDPNTIVWCTAFPPTPGSKPVTYPIVGKLTSGNKRPFPDDPGPDSMYGSSSEYRYGFTPDDNMIDIGGSMPTICSTAPTVWQRTDTILAVAVDPGLDAATKTAKQILANGGSQQAAQNVLRDAAQ